mmetsp:Transcript_19660/g.27105  ORF Transcript_19660/g.27105 Transcript_19660/m.27105 type:complete len:279 (+) Transcript_19660:31-867(+)|eukprot:CAMPEP_0201490722 /NCGR_PEP_ID=MMETSP0151_2-20130828/27174_1 /ASSEMBLY_ACC=CAM_ASM_000257 /TAXON_ID=200890 /ORGANISM="Paramoeba atlantica, Strain 621/1 / CCAP 1560/9" /LENGTH=278 /DNA_ID=CAMNT_0047876785 /DNA_START=31 /DNA_END=867 /DNA_ORIENTATION=-
MANAATTLQPPLETKELLAKGESYITHLEVKEGSNKPVYLLISTEHFYKIDPYSKKKLWVMPLFNLHEIKEAEGGLRLVYQEFDKKGAKMAKKAIKESSFKTMLLKSSDANQLTLVSIASEALMRRFWQALFEGSLIQQPDLYQGHLFVFKFDKKQKLNYRCLVLSTNRLFMTTPSETSNNFIVKWAIRYDDIELVSQVDSHPLVFLIQFVQNATSVAGIRNRPIRSKIAFQALNVIGRQQAIHDLQRTYWMWTENDLLARQVKVGKKKSMKNVMKGV